jgi:type VI secretion system protein ImpC
MDDTPMKLLVLGDFSAAPPASRAPLAQRRRWRVDLDDLDGAVRGIAPKLALPDGEVAFAQIEDFDADRLYARLPQFADLRSLRSAPPADGEGLFASLLGGDRPAVRAPESSAEPPADAIDALLRRVVAPHIVHADPDRLRQHQIAVDLASAERLRRVLHDPDFQALESAWRGVAWMVRSLQLDETLQLHLLDVHREELLADVVGSAGQPEAMALRQAIVRAGRHDAAGGPWSAVVVLGAFGPSDADIGLLAALARLCGSLGAPLLSDAAPALMTAEGLASPGWSSLRRSEVGPWIALAGPRVLLRAPYGQRTAPMEGLAFEELDGIPATASALLWGHASLAAAILLGRAFAADGWPLVVDGALDIEDLPVFTVERDQERVLQSLTEQRLGPDQAAVLVQGGLVALMSDAQQGRVLAAGLGSCAVPAAPLAGLVR